MMIFEPFVRAQVVFAILLGYLISSADKGNFVDSSFSPNTTLNTYWHRNETLSVFHVYSVAAPVRWSDVNNTDERVAAFHWNIETISRNRFGYLRLRLCLCRSFHNKLEKFMTKPEPVESIFVDSKFSHIASLKKINAHAADGKFTHSWTLTKNEKACDDDSWIIKQPAVDRNVKWIIYASDSHETNTNTSLPAPHIQKQCEFFLLNDFHALLTLPYRLLFETQSYRGLSLLQFTAIDLGFFA